MTFTLIRYLWAGPTTAVGMLFVLLGLLTGGRVRIVRGVIEVWDGAVAWLLEHATPVAGGAAAMTLGHVILGRSAAALDVSRDHEHVHVRQCERWGPFFIPAYLLAGAYVWLRGRRAYRDNPFEREAYDRAG